MRNASQIAGFIVSLITAIAICADNKSDQESAKKEPPVARSPSELAKILAIAIDEEKYDDIKEMRVPAEMLKELGTPKKVQKRHGEYLEQLPKLAKRYRSYLQAQKLLPLGKQRVKEVVENELNTKKEKGRTLTYCTGIRLTDADGKIIFELVDVAVAIDGRWYISRLCTEDTERAMKETAEP